MFLLLTAWLAGLLTLRPGGVPPVRLDVTQVGIEAGLVAMQTERLQALIDSVAAGGGGTLHFPAGVYRTGSLTLRSYTGLHLEAGAVLLGSDRMADYAQPHLLYAEGAEGITLSGPGRIDGQGEAFWDRDHRPLARPTPWILFRDCRHLRVRDLQLVRAPAHTLVLESCRFAVIDGLHIDNPLYGPNTDGIDLTSSQDIHISNTYISTGDDAICLKGGKAGPVQNVVVTNCILISDDAALKCGTGSRSDVRHCQFSQIVIRDTRYGIAFFMTQGASYEHLDFRQIHIQTGSRHRTEYPLYMDIDRRDAQTDLGRIAHIRLSGLTIETRGNCLLAGHPTAPLEDLSLQDVTLYVKEPVDLRGLRKPRGNKGLVGQGGRVDYAEQPAHLMVAHCRGLRVEGLRILGPDRPAFPRHGVYLKDVHQFELRGLTLSPERPARLYLDSCAEGLLAQSVAQAGTRQWVAHRDGVALRAVGNVTAAAEVPYYPPGAADLEVQD